MSLLKSHLTTPTTWTLDAGEETPEQFTTIANELDILTNQAGLLDLSHRGVVAIAGEERSKFLQGLTTNEIKDVRPDQCSYSSMLTPQGRFLWDFTILEVAATLILDIEPQNGAALVKSLSFYLMRTKATIEDVSGDYGIMAIVGPKAAEVVAELFPDCKTAAAPLGAVFDVDGDIKLWQDPRQPEFGWKLLVKANEYLAVWEKLAKKVNPVGFQAWENYRVQHALPRGGKELIPNNTLPLEAGLLDMNGVSFKKGCFVGQETTARTHHRGTLKKRLFQVILEGDGLVDIETPVLTPSEKEAGTITSAVCQNGKCQGLALLRLADVVTGKQLTVAGRKVTVHKPSWASWEIT